jgi:hypothetical protein
LRITRREGGLFAFFVRYEQGVFRLAGKPRSCPRLQAPAAKYNVSPKA